MSYKKICVNCGKNFESSWPNTKYCSPRCRNEYKSSLYSSYKTTQENEQQVEITPINISGKQKFLGVEIPIMEGGFGEGQKVMLAKTIAEIHGVDIKEVNRLINNNIDEFDFGIDILDLKTSDYQSPVLDNGLLTKAQWGNAKNIYLLSEQGYHGLVTLMKTKKAKQIRKQLRREYFTMRQAINQLSKEDKAWLELKHSNQDENAQYLINVATQQLTTVFIRELDGENRHLALTDMAKHLSEETGLSISSTNITDFLISEGYLVKRNYQKIENGKLQYFRGEPEIEHSPHRQPTNKFMNEFANNGMVVTKPADIRGKITYKFLNRFEDYFKKQFLEKFIYYVQNTEKGWK